MEEQQAPPAPVLKWKDAEGRTWSTYFEFFDMVRLKAAGYDIKDHERLAATLEDTYDALDFIVEIHRPQWTERGLDELGFIAVLTDSDERLGVALDRVVEGLIDFFRRLRDVIRAGIVRKAYLAAQLSTAEVLAKMEDPKVDQAITATLNRELAKVDAELERAISGATPGV